MAKIGRPTKYTEELAIKICEKIITGKSLRTICKADDMPTASSVFLWLTKYESFSEQYARACEERAEAYVEDIFEIADNATNDYMEDNFMEGKTPGYTLNGENIQRSKLRVDTRKWYVSKLKPKKYGEKLDLTTNGKDLPTPILGAASVQPDNSNNQTT